MSELVQSVDLVTAVVQLRSYRPTAEMSVHADASSRISLVVNGSVDETCRGEHQRAVAGSVVVKPAGVEHADRFGPRGATIMTIRGDRLTAGRPCWHWTHGGAISRVATGLYEAFRGGACRERLADGVHALLTLIRNDDAPAPSRPAPPQWLLDLRSMLDEDVGGDVMIRDLARRVGRHPVYVNRVFRRCFGTTISEHRRARRLQIARHLLANSGVDLAEVALECGYADQSHLTRDVRAATGLPPSRYRALMSR